MLRLLCRLMLLLVGLIVLLLLAPLLSGSVSGDGTETVAAVLASQERIFGESMVPVQQEVLAVFEDENFTGIILKFFNSGDALRLAALHLVCPLLLGFQSLLLLFCCALPGFLYLRRRAFYYRCSTERQDRVVKLALLLISLLLYLGTVQRVRPGVIAEAMLLPLWTVALAARTAAFWSCPR